MVRRRVRRVLMALALVGSVLAAACDATPPPPPVRPSPSPTSPSPSPTPEPTASPPSPSTPPVATSGVGDGVVGFVGCSVTRNAVTGYAEVGGRRLWPAEGVSYGGGSVSRWARTIGQQSGQWRDFEGALEANPGTRGLWVQLCTAGTSGDDQAAATALLDELRRRVPDVPIWVSAQPDYVGHECRIAGARGPGRMQELADQLVVEGHALAGPVVGPLTRDQTLDGCHANAEGQDRLGEQLVAFFGEAGTDGAVASMPEVRRRRPPPHPEDPGESPT